MASLTVLAETIVQNEHLLGANAWAVVFDRAIIMIEQTNNSGWSAAVAANERMSSCRRWIKRVPRGVAKGRRCCPIWSL